MSVPPKLPPRARACTAPETMRQGGKLAIARASDDATKRACVREVGFPLSAYVVPLADAGECRFTLSANGQAFSVDIRQLGGGGASLAHGLPHKGVILPIEALPDLAKAATQMTLQAASLGLLDGKAGYGGASRL